MTDQTDLDRGLQSLQFGDSSNPEDRANIQRMLRLEAANAQQSQREADELTRSQAALNKFKDGSGAHLKDDPLAEAAAERAAFDIMMEDLAKHGHTAEAMTRALGRPPGPADIAAMHLKMRAGGHDVRSAEAFLEEAAQRVDDWRGTGSTRARSSAFAARANQSLASRGRQPLADYAAPEPAPGADPQAVRASNIVQQMKANRAAQKATSLRDIIRVSR